MIDSQSVCVVTQPLSSIGESTTQSFLDVISGVATVSLITANLPDNSAIREECTVIEISSRGTGSNPLTAGFRYALNQLKMCDAIRRTDKEIIIFFGATSYFLPILFSKVIGRTVVLLPRGDVPLTLYLQWQERLPKLAATGLASVVGGLERLGYRLADAIITYSPSMADGLGLQKYDKKLYTNGARYVDTETFYPRQSYEERDRIVGFLGRLDEEKRIRELAEVAKRLPDDITFVFVGDGALSEWLQNNLAAEIEAGTIEYVGWVDHEEVPEQLSRLRLLVLPSQPTEGLPTVILEAFACSTPAYATPVSGIPDVVRNGETGFLIDNTDPVTMAERIENALNEDLHPISRRCRELVEEEYSLEAAQKRYSEILSSIGRTQ